MGDRGPKVSNFNTFIFRARKFKILEYVAPMDQDPIQLKNCC